LFLETSAKRGYNIKTLFTKVSSELPTLNKKEDSKDNCKFQLNSWFLDFTVPFNPTSEVKEEPESTGCYC
jgi:hypothetical protein